MPKAMKFSISLVISQIAGNRTFQNGCLCGGGKVLAPTE